MLVVIFVKT